MGRNCAKCVTTAIIILSVSIVCSEGVVFIPILLTEAAVIVPRDHVTWKAKTIDGLIKLFIGAFGVWSGILMENCGPSIIDALGITSNTSFIDNMTNCYIAMGTTAVIAWGGLILSSDGSRAGWINAQDFDTSEKRSTLTLCQNISRLNWGMDFILILLINILVLFFIHSRIMTAQMSTLYSLLSTCRPPGARLT